MTNDGIANSGITQKCALCSKKARKGCTQHRCLKCCDDDSNCTAHREQKQQLGWKKQVMEGTTMIQQQAKLHRSQQLKQGRFREPGLNYIGDTVIIWNMKEYLANPKWKEEAVRKCNKRKAVAATDESSGAKMLSTTLIGTATVAAPSKERLRNNRKRFRDNLEAFHQKGQSIQSKETAAGEQVE